jgi:hypothetical protein
MLMKTTMMRKNPETNFLMEKMPKMQKSGRKEQSREDTMPLYKDDGYQESLPMQLIPNQRLGRAICQPLLRI